MPSSVTSVGEPAVTIAAYPNPVSDYLTISSEPHLRAGVTITDGLGRRVDVAIVSSADDGITVDASQLPAGMYFISVPGSAPRVIPIVKK